MSRTRKTSGSKSPIKKYLRYSGGTGTFSYFDKSKGSEGEQVELDEVSLIVLDVRSSITGFHEEKKATISSNIVLNTKTEPLKVVSFANKKRNDIATGLYADIKADVAKVGGKFTANIIGLVDFGEGWEVVNLQLFGVALNSWIEFTTEHDNNSYYDYYITFKRGELSKRDNGKNVPVTKKEEEALDAKLKKNPRAPKPVWFYTVAFDIDDLTPEQVVMAEEEDEEVDVYFEGFSAAPEKEEPAEGKKGGKVTDAPEPSSDDDEEEDDLPF